MNIPEIKEKLIQNRDALVMSKFLKKPNSEIFKIENRLIDLMVDLNSLVKKVEKPNAMKLMLKSNPDKRRQTLDIVEIFVVNVLKEEIKTQGA